MKTIKSKETGEFTRMKDAQAEACVAAGTHVWAKKDGWKYNVRDLSVRQNAEAERKAKQEKIDEALRQRKNRDVINKHRK